MVEQLEAGMDGQSSSGSLPSSAMVQIPSLPGTLQVRQGPLHGVLQQKLSTQVPSMQSDWTVQGSPIPWGTWHSLELQM
jgi:hypothetical protein